MCTETEHIPEGTHHKPTFTNQTQPFTAIHTHQHTQLTHKKATHQLHTAGTALCKPFNLRYVHLLVLRMVTEGMQVMDNIK
jgi:hypothetical protein